MDDGYNAANTSPLVWEINLLGRISPGRLTAMRAGTNALSWVTANVSRRGATGHRKCGANQLARFTRSGAHRGNGHDEQRDRAHRRREPVLSRAVLSTTSRNRSLRPDAAASRAQPEGSPEGNSEVAGGLWGGDLRAWHRRLESARPALVWEWKTACAKAHHL